jgi:autotransporter-associated beta strand protein
VNATLHGAGNLLLGVEGTGAVDWQLRGDNSDYRGAIEAYPNSAARLGVDLMSATALGGNPPEFLQHGFYLANAGVNVTNVSVAIADANRGVTISNATVNVGADLGFSISSQTLLGGTVAKTGSGTWTLGGPSASASDATLSVSAGPLAFAAEDAAAGVAVSFADGSALGVCRSADGSSAWKACGVVLTNGLFAASATLPVRIIAPESGPSDTFRLAVFTAPASTVDALLPTLAGSATSGKSAAVSFSAGPAFDLGGVSVKTVSASVAPAAFMLIVQ